MRVLLQRVSGASVTIDGAEVGAIGKRVLLLVGVTHQDSQREADFLAAKCAYTSSGRDPAAVIDA